MHSSYLRVIVDNKKFTELAYRITACIFADIAMGMPIDHIACRGASGMTMASAVSLLSGVPLIIVRKEEDVTHSEYRTECDTAPKDYVIIDDFISKGTTVHAIAARLEHSFGQDVHLRKIYLYNDGIRQPGKIPGIPVHRLLWEEDGYITEEEL